MRAQFHLHRNYAADRWLTVFSSLGALLMGVLRSTMEGPRDISWLVEASVWGGLGILLGFLAHRAHAQAKDLRWILVDEAHIVLEFHLGEPESLSWDSIWWVAVSRHRAVFYAGPCKRRVDLRPLRSEGDEFGRICSDLAWVLENKGFRKFERRFPSSQFQKPMRMARAAT